MYHRQTGSTWESAAAKAGISVRSGRRIDKAGGPRPAPRRNWRTRDDPLDAVWESELLPLLTVEPSLTGTTLLEYLLDHYPEHYDQSVLRTLQRRVKQWRALEGPDKDIVFRQQAVVAIQGFSDFSHPGELVLIVMTSPLNTCSTSFVWLSVACAVLPSCRVVRVLSRYLKVYSELCD